MLIYLWALPRVRRALTTRTLEGEVQYKRGDQRIAITPSELTPERVERIVSLVRVIGDDLPPKRVPSPYECKVCNIGPADCPARAQATRQTVATTAEF